MTSARAKPIPSRDELVDYNHGVAGHAGTMCDVDGELFIKPCTKAELDFYQSANSEYPEFADLMPEFYGSLSLANETVIDVITDGISTPIVNPEIQPQTTQLTQEEKVDGVTWVPNKTKKIKTDLSVVLQNASSGFTRPNILDAKLGRRLWADDAPLEKKHRFDKIASETTHGELHFRIAGMRVYRGSLEKSDLSEDDYMVYDKDYGRVTVNKDNVVDSFRKFVYNPAAGIDAELGRAVAAAFVRDLRRVVEVLRAHESRMYSASLLFVFEGDGEKLREAIEANNRAVEEFEAAAEVVSAKWTTNGDDSKEVIIDLGRSSTRVDSGIALMAGDEADMGGDGDDSDISDEDELSSLPKMYQLKLIDFAHAEWTPGQGPDENAIKGVESLIDIFEKLTA